MADRFPSLDEFADGQTEAKPATGSDDAVVASSEDFLARERAVLGDEADKFATPADAKVSPTAADDDLLGGDGDEVMTPTIGKDAQTSPAQFESSFPAIDTTTNEQVGPGGSITGLTAPPSAFTQQSPEDEPEAVKEWRTKRDDELSRRAAASEERKAATISKAQQDIDDYYESYNKRVDKAKERVRKEAEEFLAKREDTAVGGTAWDRIAKLIDLSGKGAKGGGSGSGKERFRTLLTDLKKDEKAPGASGI